MGNVFRDFYEHVFALLDSAPELDSYSIPSDNIHPSNDVAPAGAGVVVNYGWRQGSKDRRAQRAVGTFELRVSSPDNKLSALDVLEVIVGVMTAKRLTAAADKVVVHKITENTVLDDEELTDTNRLQATTDLDVRLIAAPS